jgi:hypothetical protein
MGLRAILQAILVGLLLPQLPITELSPLVPLPLASPLKLGTGFPAVPLTLQVWVGHCGRIHEILKVSGNNNYSSPLLLTIISIITAIIVVLITIIIRKK